MKKKNLKSVKRSYVRGAKRRDYDFQLLTEEFNKLILQPCFYCGGMNKSGFNGIDRVNNNLGYIIENSVPCCSLCNKMKSNLHYRDWLDHIEKISVFQRGKF